LQFSKIDTPTACLLCAFFAFVCTNNPLLSLFYLFSFALIPSITQLLEFSCAKYFTLLTLDFTFAIHRQVNVGVLKIFRERQKA